MASNDRVRQRVRPALFILVLVLVLASLPHVAPQGITIHRPIIYGNTAVVLTQKERESLLTPDHTHRWTVAVRSAASADSETVGGKDDLSYFIKRVTFKLHDTYTVPTRSEWLPHSSSRTFV